VGHGDPDHSAGQRDHRTAERHDARRHGHERHQLLAAVDDDHELRADERGGGDQCDDHRHELHWGHGGGVQRGERHVYGDVGHGDPDYGAGRRDHGPAERHDTFRDGDERDQLPGAADDHQLHA